MELNLPNEDLANHLQEIAYYYNLSRDIHRNRAFSEAAKKIEIYHEPIISGIDAKLRVGYGIGESTMEVIDEYLETGDSSRLKNLKVKFEDRSKVVDLFRTIHGIGPVNANKFYDLGFRTLDDLWFNASLTEAQKTSIYYRDHLKLRVPRYEVDFIDKSFHQFFPNLDIVTVGSYRREEPDSGDIDVLIKQTGTGVLLQDIIAELKRRGLLIYDFAQGQSKYLGLLQLPIRPVRRLDVLLISPDSWGSALLYFTGSQRFNILLRSQAKKLGYRLNEYGLYDLNKNKLNTPDEQTIFNLLGVKYLSPKERTRDLVNLELV